MPWMSKELIETKALAHRRWLGFDDRQGIDPMTGIMKLKAKASKRPFNYLLVEDQSNQKFEAWWDYERGVLKVPRSVFRAMNALEPRALFTFAHETGHILLNHKASMMRAPTAEQGGQYSRSVRQMEHQANIYAASLLIPNIEEVRKITVTEIQRRYWVSRTTAEIWLSERQ